MLVGDLLCWGGCEAKSLVGIAWGSFHFLEPRLGFLNKHLLQRPVDTKVPTTRIRGSNVPCTPL
jgi:hypothetical protein